MGVGWGEGEQKFRSNYNRKYILFQKKGPLSQQQPNFTSSYDKHVGFNSYSSNSKKIIFQTKNSKMCPSREDKGISPIMETTNKRSRALGFSRRLLNSSSNGASYSIYSSAWNKWVSWCVEQDIDPVQCNVNWILDFLTFLLESEYEYRIICTHRSAISALHNNIEGRPVGEPTQVSSLITGVFNRMFSWYWIT